MSDAPRRSNAAAATGTSHRRFCGGDGARGRGGGGATDDGAGGAADRDGGGATAARAGDEEGAAGPGRRCASCGVGAGADRDAGHAGDTADRDGGGGTGRAGDGASSGGVTLARSRTFEMLGAEAALAGGSAVGTASFISASSPSRSIRPESAPRA
ncbi:MAG: hypothetical protein JWP87_4165 [Labilithrix sp.]|nr:hypothetical protein [Labilithrix sp.]